MLPSVLYVQEQGSTLYVNRTAEGASGHSGAEKRAIGVYRLEKTVRIVTTTEDIAPAEQSAAAPQD